MRTMARSRLPLTVSGMTWRSRCIWDAERPLGAPGRGLGRSTGSQGLALSRSSLMRNLKKDEMQARRAPTVTGEGSRPERPMPWAKEKTSWGET